jgi:uncharacterized protein (TIGR04255 family)
MRWQPAHEANAIERVSVTFQFPQDMPAKQWQQVLGSQTPKLQEASFGFEDIRRSAQFIIGPAGLSPQPQDISNVPSNRRIFRCESTAEELSLQPSQLMYITPRYISWKFFVERIYLLLQHFIDESLNVLTLNSIKLEYWDRFVFDGEPKDVVYRELFRSNSRYIPAFSFEQSELWHSHIGYFVRFDPTVKRLINFNVDTLDLTNIPDANSPEPPPPKRSAGIYSMAQDTLEASVAPDTWPNVTIILDELHTILKKVLADAITSEAAERIALNYQAPP